MALGYALAAAAILFSLHYAAVNAADFALALREISFGAVAASLGLFCLQIAINAVAFAYLNQAFGVTSDKLKIARIWSGTLLAKYVPGGLWHVVGRGMILSRLGIPARTTFFTGLAEQSASLLICALVAVVSFVMIQPQAPVVAWGACIVLPTVCAVVTLLAAKKFTDVAAAAISLLLYAMAMVPYTLGYFCLISPNDPLRAVAALFAGTVAGVVIPVPGGLGVRESVASLLSASVDTPRIFGGFLVARVIILVSEALAGASNIRVVRGVKEE